MNKWNVKQREVFVYVAVFLYCAALFLKRVNLPLNEGVLNKIMTLGAMLCVANIFFDRTINIRGIILSLVTGFLLLVDSLPTGSHEILYLFFIIWGCRNVDNKKIIKNIFYIVLVMTVITALGTLFGVVNNELFVQNGDRYRYGLGYTPWSILPFQFMSLCMLYVCCRKKKTPLLHILVMSVLAIVIGVLTDTKTSIVMTLFGLCVLYYFQDRKIKNWKRLKILVITPTFLAALSFFATYLYNTGNAVVAKINIFLNYRITYQSVGIARYGIGLWANPETLTAVSTAEAYYGIDNQFVALAVNWGLVALAFVLVLYTWLISYLIKQQDQKMLIFVMLMLFMALMWSRLLVLIEVEFVVCFSDVFSSRRVEKCSPKYIVKRGTDKYAQSSYNS